MTKIFKISSLLLLLLLTACKDNDNKEMYQYFQIKEEFEGKYEILNWPSLTIEEKHKYPKVQYVINSYNDFPTEYLPWMNELKENKIDFDRYTLLVAYDLIPGIVKGHNYYWRKDLESGVFQFILGFKNLYDQPEEDEEGIHNLENWTYYRTAVLVDKLPANAEVEFWYAHEPSTPQDYE